MASNRMGESGKKDQSLFSKTKENIGNTTELFRNSKDILKQQKAAEAELLRLRQEYDRKLRAEASDEAKAAIEAQYKQQLENQEKLAKEAKKDAEEAKKILGDSLNSGLEAFTKATSSLKNQLDSTMEDFLENQAAIAYNLNGSSKTFDSVTSNLSDALSGTGYVKQRDVYQKLTDLVKSGIVYNVEQRAYLSTIAEDMGMAFENSSKALNRLINLQREDISSQRMAIEASLKTFLNQNYQTSLYIKEGFYSVSEALIEAQSIMTTESAMGLEASVQQWLGSLYSMGMSDNAVTSLASAIGKLGSGDYELFNDGIGKLVALGASRANLDIGNAINYGLSGNDANQLMQGIVSYMSEMVNSDSNAVKNAFSKLFGISVSDMVAASQVGNVGSVNGITTDIGDALLDDTNKYIYITTKISNALDNFIYSWATNVAGNETKYMIYKAVDALSSLTSATLSGTGVNLGIATMDLGAIAGALPIVALAGMGGFSALGKSLQNLGSSATDIFTKLQDKGSYNDISIAGSMLGFDKTSGISKSGSMIINGETSDVAASAKSSAKKLTAETLTQEEAAAKTVDDVYNLLFDSIKPALEILPTTSFATNARISETANTVTIGNDLTYLQDMLTLSAMNIQNIYLLLSAWSTGSNITKDSGIVDVETNNWNTSLDWISNAKNIIG